MALRTDRIRGVTLLRSELLLRRGVPHAFTTRAGGVSTGPLSSLNLGVSRGDDPRNVEENYRRVCAAAGLDWQGVVFSPQVHGSRVRVADSSHRGMGLLRPAEEDIADASVTDRPGVVPVIFTADCTPILLYDPRHNAVGAVHAGWRGTAGGILARAVETMTREYGTRPEELLAAIGPAICQDCFECGEDVALAMHAAFGPEADPLMPRRGEKWFPDVKGLNRLHLLRAGVPPEQIEVSPECTRENPALFWSHRRDGAARGSQAAMIGICE